MSIPISQFAPPLPFCSSNYRLVFYICNSISVPQISSSVPFFRPYICYDMLRYAKSLQSCLTLYDPIDGSPPGSPIPGIHQARTLEWVATSFSNA